MNYLAHLHLGGPAPQQLLGSLYGDFVKGSLEGRFAPALEAAIRLHRHIDSYTDQHPLVLAALSRFPRERRRFAGIVLDVFFDHCLARHWEDYAEQPLGQFTEDFTGCCSPSPNCQGGWHGLRRSWRRMTGWGRMAILPRWSRCSTALPGACRGLKEWLG